MNISVGNKVSLVEMLKNTTNSPLILEAVENEVAVLRHECDNLLAEFMDKLETRYKDSIQIMLSKVIGCATTTEQQTSTTSSRSSIEKQRAPPPQPPLGGGGELPHHHQPSPELEVVTVTAPPTPTHHHRRTSSDTNGDSATACGDKNIWSRQESEIVHEEVSMVPRSSPAVLKNQVAENRPSRLKPAFMTPPQTPVKTSGLQEQGSSVEKMETSPRDASEPPKPKPNPKPPLKSSLSILKIASLSSTTTFNRAIDIRTQVKNLMGDMDMTQSELANAEPEKITACEKMARRRSLLTLHLADRHPELLLQASVLSESDRNSSMLLSLSRGVQSFINRGSVNRVHSNDEPSRSSSQYSLPPPSSSLSSLLLRIQIELDVWLHGLVIAEHSETRVIWDLIVFCFLIYICFAIPYKLTFIWPQEETSFFYNMSLASDFVFNMVVVVNLFTAFRNHDGLIQWNIPKIAHRYVTSWFLIDLISGLPWDRIVYAFVDQDANWAAFLRLVRLMALLKFKLRFKNLERNLDNPFSLRLFKSAFTISVTVHWFACITHICSRHTLNEDDWLGFADFHGKTNGLKYITLLYWVSTKMIGESSVPNDFLAVMVSLAVFWGGLLMYFTVCSNLVTTLVNMNLPNIEYNKSTDKRTTYMKQLGVPKDLRLKVFDYFEEFNQITHGVNAQMFLQELPYHLRQQIAVFLNEKSLEKLQVFDRCALPFITAVIMRLKVAVCLEGDVLCIEGDLGEDMYFVISGKLHVYKRGVGKVATLREGDYFGEGLMLVENARRNASVKAVMACTLYSLNKEMFKEIHAAYPDDTQVFFKMNK